MVDFIFNIINLIVIIVLCIYAFNKYLLPTFSASFKKDSEYLDSLIYQKESFVESQRNTEQLIFEQEKLCDNLKIKIEQWKNFVDKSNSKDKVEKSKYIKVLENKLMIQSNRYKLIKERNQVVDVLICKLKEDLINYFDNESNARNYLASILNVTSKKN